MSKRILNLMSILFVLILTQFIQAADIVNPCDTTTEFTFAEGGITVGGGNPSGDCIYFVTRSGNTHLFAWNITADVATGDKFYFDVKNEMVLGSTTIYCWIYHDGLDQPCGLFINGLTNGATIDSTGWKSCNVDIPVEMSHVDRIVFPATENDRVVSFDNFRLTQLCPESTTISIRTLPVSPSTTEAYAARQLQKAFQTAMHVTPLINPATEKSIKVRLGLASQFSSGVGDSNSQAYIIRKPSAGLFELVGNSSPAVLWAVDEFSKQVLNVSWTVAGTWDIDVNGLPADLNTVTLNKVGVPGIAQRGWILDDDINGYAYENNIDNWMSRNRQNATTVAYPYLIDGNDSLNPKDRLLERGISADTTVHSFSWLVPVSLFDTHPEYFPLINGERVPSADPGPQLCISNTTVQQMIIDQAEEAFANHPEVVTFGVVPNDGTGAWCQCENCKLMDKADPIINPCDAITVFTFDEGGITTGGGNPTGNCVYFVTRSDNSHLLTWDIDPNVISGDRLSFDVKNDMQWGSATIYCWIYHDGSGTPYTPSINGLTGGTTIDSAGWKSCYVDISAGVDSIDYIAFVVPENTKVVSFDNLNLTQNNGDQVNASPLFNFGDILADFILPIYDTNYSQEGGIVSGGNPDGNCVEFVTREYNNHILMWNIDPSVISGDRLFFDVKNDMQWGSATIYCWIYHDGSGAPYTPSINGLTGGTTIDSVGWKSCYVDISAGVDSIDYIAFVVAENTKVVHFDNLLLTQKNSDNVYSNRLIHLVNNIAQATCSQYPDKYIGTLAYSDYAPPPAVDVNGNVSITLCAVPNLMKSITDANDAFNFVQMTRLNGWLEKTQNISLWEYYWFSGSDFCPPPFTRVMCQEIHDLNQLGIKGITPETKFSRWHNMGLLNYAFAQMTWDPSLTFDNILSDYCKARYGQAASSMQSYHSLYESIIRTNGFALNAIFGAGEQHIPAAFTETNINTLKGYLNSAHSTTEASGTLAQRYAVNRECDEFEQFRRLRVDPVGITNIGSNVISNPGAEGGYTDWGIHVESGSYSFAIDTSVKHSGSNSFNITCTGANGNGRWYQTYRTVISGRKYGLSFWVYASGGAYGNVTVISGSNNVEVYYDDTDSQWIRVICPEITADGTAIDIYLQCWGTGTVYFDDIFLAALPVPTIVSTPSPVDSAMEVSVTPTLTWTAGSNTTSHDVYFGTSQSEVSNATHSSAVYRGNQTGTTYVPGTLTASTTYYWRIDEVGYGNTVTGTVWSFTTNNGTPVFVAAGAVTSGTGTITPALPAGIATGDILLLFLETSNQAISISNQNGGTWTAVTNSPQGTGTAAGTTGARLTVFWSRYNGTQGVPTASDSGDHQMGRIIAIRGAVSTGNPWDVTAGGVEAASDTSGSIPGATTTVGNTLVVAVVVASLPDATGTANFSSWANGNLTSVTERTDNTVTAGNGGGLGVVTGIKATAGAYGNTTVTLASSAYKGMMSIAIKP